MDKRQLPLLLAKYGINPKLASSATLIPAYLIDKYRNRDKEGQSAASVLQEIKDHEAGVDNGRTAPWSLDQIVGMYFAALSAGASYAQVDASSMENYGVTFGTIFVYWCLMYALQSL